MKISSSAAIVLAALSFYLVFSVGIGHAQGEEITSQIKIANAIRVSPQPPKIDGVLDDDVWKSAPIHAGFLQSEPNEGDEATEKTTFQIAYDDEAIYFGVFCYDSEPENIVCRLTRRDGRIEADSISISLDPHYDHQTGYWFTAYASGCVRDGTYSDDRMEDSTWNAVWEVQTKTHDR